MNQLKQIPHPSSELQVLTFLNSRMNLTSGDLSRLYFLTKGFEGELRFYHLLRQHQSSNSINMFDLRLQVNHSEFQIDSLLLFQEQAYLIEIKNFEGDYYISKDKWISIKTKKEIQNPLLQLQRSERLLHYFFQQNGLNLQIQSYLIFIHPEFFLYQAPYEMQFIFPSQLSRFIQGLNNLPDALSSGHREIQEVLVQQHIGRSTHEKFPIYEYRQLRKGLMCGGCGGVLSDVTQSKVKCTSCGQEELKVHSTLRNVYEFSVLFPEEKISVNRMYDWCGERVSKRMIRNVLMKELKAQGVGRSTNYIFHDDQFFSLLQHTNRYSPGKILSAGKLLSFK